MAEHSRFTARAVCPNCGRVDTFQVYFRYSEGLRHHYLLGDAIRWGDENVGEPGHRRILIRARGGPCRWCEQSIFEFGILVVADRLAALFPAEPDTESDTFQILVE